MDCNQEKTNGHLLIMHYGVEHNISMELYNKSQIQATRSRDPRACTTKDNNDRRKEGKYPKQADIRFCSLRQWTFFVFQFINNLP